MRWQRGSETLQVKYLLGNLTEEEQVQVEDRAFAGGGDVSAREPRGGALIDAEGRGELSRSDRRSFELRFLASRERRRKVEFARALATIASEAKAQESPAAGRPFSMSAFRGWN